MEYDLIAVLGSVGVIFVVLWGMIKHYFDNLEHHLDVLRNDFKEKSKRIEDRLNQIDNRQVNTIFQLGQIAGKLGGEELHEFIKKRNK